MDRKHFIYIGATIGGLIGSWLGSMLDHGSFLGAWSILIGGVGGIVGVIGTYQITKNL